jgi:spore germination protein KC
MKTQRLVMLHIALLLFLSGCVLPKQYPIENIQNILVAGVDIENGQIKLTVLTDKIISGGQAGNEKIVTQIYSGKGVTVSEAENMIKAHSEKNVSWYHLKYIVIGEEAAKRDIKEVLDYFIENDETRFSHELAVTKGMPASEFFAKVVTPQVNLSDDLDSLFIKSEQIGLSSEVSMLDYARNSESAWSDLYIPTVQVIPTAQKENAKGTEGGGQEAEYLTKLGGFALFKNNMLAGYLDERQAMGLNIATNKLQNAIFTVTDMNGKPVSLEIVSSKADIKTDLSGMPSAEIRIKLDSFLQEYHESAGVTKDEYIKYLEDQQNNYVRSIITEALSQAQLLGTDVFGIGSALYHAHPVDSQKIRDKWSELFPAMAISVQAESKIRSTYNMQNAVGK